MHSNASHLKSEYMRTKNNIYMMFIFVYTQNACYSSSYTYITSKCTMKMSYIYVVDVAPPGYLNLRMIKFWTNERGRRRGAELFLMLKMKITHRIFLSLYIYLLHIQGGLLRGAIWQSGIQL